MLGADRHERSEERCGYRNGSRLRLLTTQVGDIPLSIPKLRAGSFFRTILEPRRRIDQALHAVIMEAWVKGVSTRKVDALVAAIGSEAGMSRSEVSRICQGLDAQIQAFLERPLDGSRYPCLHLDATDLHGRLGKTLQVCSRADVVAMGVNEEIKRGTRVVGIFPNAAAITRLVGAVLLEQDEHWQLEGRRMVSLESMAAIPPSAEALPEPDQERGAVP